ncbi:DnaJ domain [Macleaya cordata]|uniref:DnaJ domain n=1 Tax=Macleaya cordata TaxID=56857 RepID=A0A200PT91_MACCD|nr:DnaJ domain [Macleaya cordata]
MDTEEERSRSYYGMLGVDRDSSASEIRRAYRKLAMKWHPDRWTRTPSLLGEAKQKFQKIQEAYSVLSDKRKRTMYDAGLYDPNQEEEEEGDHDEGFSDFLQEMVSLMASVKRKENNKVYSMEELQQMFMEMVQGFDDYSSHLPCFDVFRTEESSSPSSSSSCCSPILAEDFCRSSKRPRSRWESNHHPFMVRDSSTVQ